MTPQAENALMPSVFSRFLSAARVDPSFAMHAPTPNPFFSLEIQKP
jgi:hypothetical protein